MKIESQEAFFTSEKIANFWNANPCLQDFVHSSDWSDFFDQHDRYKHEKEPHTAREIAKVDWSGKRVLEIGPGEGCEAAQIIRAGAKYNAIDLTTESIRRLEMRFALSSLPYESLRVMNAEKMEIPDASYDIVFSNGVIHHSPRIGQIVAEVHRVLRPGGTFIAMVYHRNSVNYFLSICLFRRLGIFLLLIPGMPRLISTLTGEKRDRLVKHLDNLHQQGFSYLRMRNFIHRATDGPDNVYSSVFTEEQIRAICSAFGKVEVSKHFLNERHLPLLRNLLPRRLKSFLASSYGWHLWIHAVKQ